ncbi:MAG: hypothetical protein AAF697_11230 [Pseudomonadota bacterium]
MDSRLSHQHGSLQQRLELALGRELRPGERVTWSGTKMARIEWKVFALYIFAIPWTAFALFWTFMAAQGVSSAEADGAGLLAWAFPLFGTPFIIVGLGMLAVPFGPLFFRGRVLFAVTDQRVLQITLGRKLSVKSVPSNRIGQWEREESPDGTGSLKLAIRVGKDSDGDRHTEHFDLGRVANIMAANRAVEALSS